MSPRSRQNFLGAVLLLVFSGCSAKSRSSHNDTGVPSDDGGSGGTSLPTLDTVAAFWQAFGDALCVTEIRCVGRFEAGALCPRPDSLLEFCGGFCHPWIRQTDLHGRPAQIAAALAAGRSRYDSVAAASCLDSIRNGPCEWRPADEMLDVVCKSVFVGVAAQGSPCGHSLECQDGSYCNRTLSVCPGICTTRPAAGESCERVGEGATTDEQCQAGLACSLGPSMNETGQPTAVECGATKTCESGRVCLEDSTCSPLLSSGASCGTMAALGGSICDSDLVCTDSGGGNFACLPGQAVNQACSPGTPCTPGAHCTVDGSCQGVSLPNEPCETNDNCPVGFACAQGRCAALPVSGEPCSDEMPCLEGACRNGACELLADGEACQTELTSHDPCASACYNGEVCERLLNDNCYADADCDSGRYCLANSSGAPRCQALCTP
jgi:hypothetical protein